MRKVVLSDMLSLDGSFEGPDIVVLSCAPQKEA